MSEYRIGYVYIQKIYAGIIKETDEGYIFSYDNSYLSDELKERTKELIKQRINVIQ